MLVSNPTAIEVLLRLVCLGFKNVSLKLQSMNLFWIRLVNFLFSIHSMTDNSNLVLPTTHHDCKRQVNSLVIYSENNLIRFFDNCR